MYIFGHIIALNKLDSTIIYISNSKTYNYLYRLLNGLVFMQTISKVLSKINTFIELFFLTSSDKSFIKYSKDKFNVSKPNTKDEILVDQMFFNIHIWSVAHLINFFQKKMELNSRHFHFISRQKKMLNFIFKYLRKFSRINYLYESFGSYYGFGQSYFKESEEICSKLKFHSKRELLEYSLDGILIGDLIYDTYLRVYKLPTVDLKDPRLQEILLDAHDIFFSSKNYLNTHSVKIIIISHAVYIQYGILSRLALSMNIDVYHPHWERIYKKLSLDHHFPTPRHFEYPKIFKGLQNKDYLISKAKNILEGRLKGEIDSGIKYMKTSAYQDSKSDSNQIFANNGSPKVILLLHYFFDAPHIYANMIFEDFYEWVNFVFAEVKNLDIDFVVKPHPGAKSSLDNPIIDKILKEHDHIRMIDKNVSNKKIIEEKPDLALSVYGTMAHEFAYNGIKVMLAGDHPAAAYNFTFLPKDKKEYKHYLANIDQIKINFDMDKILEFFYMHYLHPHDGKIDGNNDVFFIRQREYMDDDPEIFRELIQDSNEGKFNSLYDAYEEAYKQTNSY